LEEIVDFPMIGPFLVTITTACCGAMCSAQTMNNNMPTKNIHVGRFTHSLAQNKTNR